MAKSLRSKTKRAARGVKRNDEASVFHKTHEARATRLSAKLADSAQKPKRPRTPSPIAEAAMDLDAQPEAAAPLDAVPAADGQSTAPAPALSANQRKKLRKAKEMRSKKSKHARLVSSFKSSRSKRSKSGTAKA